MVSLLHILVPTKTSSGKFYTNEYKNSKVSRRCVVADLNTILPIKVALILHFDPQKRIMLMMTSKMMMMTMVIV
jgi:hypothetical protein